MMVLGAVRIGPWVQRDACHVPVSMLAAAHVRAFQTSLQPQCEGSRAQ